MNDSNNNLTIRKNDNETISEMIFRYVQSEIKFHDFFEVNCDLRERFQINLFLVHHYENHVRHREDDYHCRCVDLIVDVDFIRENDLMIAFFHDLIVNNYCDLWWVDDDYDRKFSSKDHEKKNSKLESIKISIEDCSVFDFQLL